MAINIQNRIKFIGEYKKNMAGNISKCCKEVGISRMRYYQWLESTKKIIDGKTFKQIIDEIDMQIMDDAEQIYKGIAIIDKDKTALFNLLRKKHPDWKDNAEINFKGEIKQMLTEEQINELINRRKTNNTGGEI